VAPPAEALRGTTRAQNRAAKRASGVQAKRVRGRVAGRPSRSYNPLVLGLAAVAVLAVAGIFLLGNPLGGGAAASPSPGETTTSEASPTPAATRLLTGCPTAAPAPMAAGESRTVTISTPKGSIVIDV
jgi:hypothetical protein